MNEFARPLAGSIFEVGVQFKFLTEALIWEGFSITNLVPWGSGIRLYPTFSTQKWKKKRFKLSR